MGKHKQNMINVFGKSQRECNKPVLQEKCIFATNTVKFLGHVVDHSGIRSDPYKISAIKEMPEPSTPTEVRRFLGMVNQLGKFLPRLAK